MRISIYGAGYVGLVTAACFADRGNHVLCMDVDQDKIDKLLRGESPIYEPGLSEMLRNNIKAERLSFTTDPQQAADFGKFQFIAVGTPPDQDGSADLQYVLSVAQGIGERINDYRIIVNKSTVPVGTADKVRATVQQALTKRQLELEFDVVSNPEFLKEGAAISDFLKPDRIIIGADTEQARMDMRALYAPFNRNRERIVIMDTRSAELTKYAANALLATKISFMNELSNIASRCGADIENVRHGIGSDPRIGYQFIYPGCGYGGSCFPKDVRALHKTAAELDYNAEILSAVDAVNMRQKHRLFEKIRYHFKDKLSGLTIALWGLSFKPETDDMREAPSRTLLHALWDAGIHVKAYDPVAMPEARRIFGDNPKLELLQRPDKVLTDADALVVVTEWSEFLSPDFEVIKQTLKQPVIFDGRNLYDPKFMAENGFAYYGIGRGRSEFN